MTMQFTYFVQQFSRFMKSVLMFSLFALAIIGCKESKKNSSHPDESKDLATFFERYYEERLQFFRWRQLLSVTIATMIYFRLLLPTAIAVS